MVKGKRQFLERDQVFLLLIVYCSLCLQRYQYIYARVMHKNCLSLYLLIFYNEKFHYQLESGVCRLTKLPKEQSLGDNKLPPPPKKNYKGLGNQRP